MELQNMGQFGIKDCLTETNLGWEGFGIYKIDREFYTLTINMLENLFVIQSQEVG